MEADVEVSGDEFMTKVVSSKSLPVTDSDGCVLKRICCVVSAF